MSNYTELSTLGEFGLIDHLTKTIRLQNPSTLKGIGDDAAVLDYGNKKILVSTDMLIQGIHFDLTYTPLKHLGYKSVAVNASDIYAMNGIPKQITLSLAVSNHFSVEGLEEFYAGLYLACEKYGIDLVGGDTTSSKTGMCISITVLGEADEQDIVYRNTAKENQLICVSGDLGAAYMGLQLLEREKLVFPEKITIKKVDLMILLCDLKQFEEKYQLKYEEQDLPLWNNNVSSSEIAVNKPAIIFSNIRKWRHFQNWLIFWQNSATKIKKKSKVKHLKHQKRLCV